MTTLHTRVKKDINSVITQLEEDSNLLLQWCSNNALKANPEKFHLVLSNMDETLSVNVGQFEIRNSRSEKLLGVTLDNKLTLNEHVTNLCKKKPVKRYTPLLESLDTRVGKNGELL